MQGKNKFTLSEIKMIESLINEKLMASSDEQKRIRQTIRDIGFYWTDFHGKNTVKYNVENFRKLISSGSIVIVDDNDGIKTSIVRPVKKKQVVIESNMKQGLEPWVGKNPKVLILGSMPGDESIRQQAYYANVSRNSFWKIMYSLFQKTGFQSDKEFITSHGIALWDCVKSAVRHGSMDVNFDDGTVVPNDLNSFLEKYKTINIIVINGKGKPETYFRRFFSRIVDCKVIVLNSTSNACTIPFDTKLKEWSIILDLIK